ncbi:hypothetical protein [Sphingopyxis sp.]|uniref:hypothetical protein n=1 Tax=Sphingopyxis sp. TaxID=1908224 RepID=UPI002ED8DBE9
MTYFQDPPAHAEMRAALLASTHQNIAAAKETADEATYHLDAFGRRFDRLTMLASTIECCIDVLSEATPRRAPASEGRNDFGASKAAKLPVSEISRIAAMLNDLGDLVESERTLPRRARALACFGAFTSGLLAGAAVVLLASLLMFGASI